METAINNYVRYVEDTRHVLTKLMHALVQKRPPQVEETDGIIRETFRRLADALGAQIISVLPVHSKQCGCPHARFTYISDSVHENDPGRMRKLEKALDQLQKCELSPSDSTAEDAVQAGEAPKPGIGRHASPCFDRLLKQFDIPIHSAMNAPLVVCGKCRGNVVVVNKSLDHRIPASFTAADLALLQDVSAHVALLIQRSEEPQVPLSDVEAVKIVARLSKCDAITIGPDYPLDVALLQSIGADTLKRYLVLPLSRSSARGVNAAVSNPQDTHCLTDFEIATGQRIERKVVATEQDIRNAIARAFPEASNVSKVAQQIAKEYSTAQVDQFHIAEETDSNAASVVNLANRIIEDAYALGASDIHVEPFENKLVVRYRIDGVCREMLSLPRAVYPIIVARLKIMSELDIAEHRLPQDGRIVFKKYSPQFDLDLRVSVVPANHGESIVMRILDKKKSTLPLDKLGFSDYNLQMYRQLINIPYGMVLHCGPTGSGKSMTLYAALNEINSPEYKIVTAEDPIEYTLPRIIQVQMKPDIGLTFARALRCFLRQDPDIILVGEVRDAETAEIAIEAALTGHLIFSTLHTNDASLTITRLMEIGIEPFLISTTLACICAQRLLRRLCTCKAPAAPTDAEARLLARAKDGSPGKFFSAAGCDKCGKSGYKGRTGIHELLKVTDELRDMITRRCPAEQLKAAARRGGMRTLFEDAMEKVKLGTTSLTEALTAVIPDELADPAERPAERSRT